MTIVQNLQHIGSCLQAEADRPIILHVENSLYQRFLENHLKQAERSFQFVDRLSLAEAISQTSEGVLILQSDNDEYGLIEIAARLKRLFLDKLRIILLSTDYRMSTHSEGVVDAFIQYPVRLEEILIAVDARNEISRRVLLIDDSRLVHTTIVGPLREAGYEVFQAFDGQEGVDMARQVRPRLIICDVEMPRLNGFEACKAIRNSEESGHAYIIMSSSLGSAADQQRGFEAGVDEYITKPVIIDELINRLNRALRQPNAGRENILVVEKDDSLARNIMKALAKHGFRPHYAPTIRAMARVLARINCDLAICEIKPQDGSIIDLFKTLDLLSADRRPDVIVLAERDNYADARMVMNVGASGVINKPLSSDNMLALIERSIADRRAQRERTQLQRYVSKASVRMAIEKSVMSGDTAAARADRKKATILFTDIVGFTSRCERYTPRQVVEQVNALFEVMTRVIMENDGDIDKFIGDACMAFWLDDGSYQSCQKSLDALLIMRKALKDMNETSSILSQDPISLRIGVNVGDVILCDIGAVEARVDLTIIGDAVNLAARCESACKQYGVENLISGETLEHCRERYAARIIDRVRVKGKDKPVICYELIEFADKAPSHVNELIDIFEAGVSSYTTGDFEEALKYFTKSDLLEPVQSEGEVNPSRLYIDRCKTLIADRPKKWDGIWQLTSK